MKNEKYISSDSSFLASLQAKRLLCKRIRTDREGEHWSRRRGEGFNFADYKEYTYGDDVRLIDWSKSAASARWHIKRFETELCNPTTLIIDSSRSMAVPKNDEKCVYAANVTLALAFVAMARNDPVTCSVLSGVPHSSGIVQTCPPCRSVHEFHALAHYVIEHTRSPRGTIGLPAVIPRCVPSSSKKGLVIIVSDFLFELHEIYSALWILQQAGNNVVTIRVIGAHEANLTRRTRAVKAIDSETGEAVHVNFEPQKYYHQMMQHSLELRRWCQQRNIKHIVASTDEPVRDFILMKLAEEGLIQ